MAPPHTHFFFVFFFFCFCFVSFCCVFVSLLTTDSNRMRCLLSMIRLNSIPPPCLCGMGSDGNPSPVPRNDVLMWRMDPLNNRNTVKNCKESPTPQCVHPGWGGGAYSRMWLDGGGGGGRKEV